MFMDSKNIPVLLSLTLGLHVQKKDEGDKFDCPDLDDVGIQVEDRGAPPAEEQPHSPNNKVPEEVPTGGQSPVVGAEDLTLAIAIPPPNPLDDDQASPPKVVQQARRTPRRKRPSAHITTPFTSLDKRARVEKESTFVYDPNHTIPRKDMNKLYLWICSSKTDRELRPTVGGVKNKNFFRELFVSRGWLSDEVRVHSHSFVYR